MNETDADEKLCEDAAAKEMSDQILGVFELLDKARIQHGGQVIITSQGKFKFVL